MNCERTGSPFIIRFRPLNRVSNPRERPASLVERRIHRCRKVIGNPMAGKKFVKPAKVALSGSHHVNTSAAVDMYVHKTRSENTSRELLGEVDHGCVAGNFPLVARGDGNNDAILHKHKWIQYLLNRRVQPIGAEDEHYV